VLLAVNHLWAERATWRLPSPLARAATFILVVVGWVVFRATTVEGAGRMLRGMFTWNGIDGAAATAEPIPLRTAVIWLLALIVFVNTAPTARRWVETRCLNAPRAVVLGSLFFLCVLLMRSTHLTNKASPFIYFQF
jgi:hypothetical protein